MKGFIPTGWYPTAVQFSGDGARIYVLSGKGLTSLANPRGPQPGVPPSEGQYAGSMLQGSLSVLPVPDAAALAAYTKTVLAVTPYTDAARLAPVEAPAGSPIPRKVGDPSPIKHVFYVIRENRTYDQVLGDLEEGNGDPNLCLFGEEVTPNAHALAREFVLLDNFYVDAEVSYDGHAFSTGAYATDFVEKVWPMNYGARRREYLSEGGGEDAQRLRQHHRARARVHLGRGQARRPRRAQLRRVRHARPRAPRPGRGSEPRRRRGAGDRLRSRPGGARQPDLSALGPLRPRQPARRRLARGVPGVRGERPAARACPSSAWATITPRGRARAIRRRAR